MDTIILKVRNLIADNLIATGRDVFEYFSSVSSKIFTLTESNISASSIIVLKNGAVWASSNYSFSSATGKLTVTGTLTAGDSLEVTYSYYEKYSDTELTGFIKAAISYLSVERYGTFEIVTGDELDPEPTEAEENLIAVVASILINKSIKSYKTPEITITFNENESVSQRIKKLVRQFKKAAGVLIYIDPSESYEESN
jgi:hypothetical protein